MLRWLRSQFDKRRVRRLSGKIGDLSVDEARRLTEAFEAKYGPAQPVSSKKIYIIAQAASLEPVSKALSKEYGISEFEIRAQLELGPFLLREELDEPTIEFFVRKFEALGAEVVLEDA
ncbi:MAG: hypothetical protein WD076_05390 [Parvularculaceae bacterium]